MNTVTGSSRSERGGMRMPLSGVMFAIAGVMRGVAVTVVAAICITVATSVSSILIMSMDRRKITVIGSRKGGECLSEGREGVRGWHG